jgi:hypothetical protein
MPDWLVVILICIVALAVFWALVVYNRRSAKGSPTEDRR